MRGQSSEPVELRPDPRVREGGRIAEAERWAWARVRSLRRFYTHLSVFLIVNFALVLLDISTPGETWFHIPLLGWGLLIGLHAAQAYEMLPWFTHDWEQRKFREYMEQRLGR